MRTSAAHPTRRARPVDRRSALFAVLALVVVVAFAVRLFDIQVVRASEHLDNRAEHSSMEVSRTLPGTRGTIVDANGTVLASSTTTYDVAIDPQNVPGLSGVGTGTDDWERVSQNIERAVDVGGWHTDSDRIGSLTGTSGEEVREAVADALEADPGARWVRIARHVSTEEYRALLELRLGYLSFEHHSQRVYPNGAVAGNMLGFVTADGDYTAGLEQTEAACLAPTDGETSYEQSPGELIIPGSQRGTSPKNGGTVELTIDTDLSWYLTQMIAEEVENQKALRGSVLIAEAKTGAIKAAVEVPTLDPNDIEAADDDGLRSRIFQDTFEPGSTFKAITAATLLDQGVVSQDTTVSAESWEQFDGGEAAVQDAFGHPRYDYTLAGVLIDSSNVGISKLGAKTSAETRVEYLERFGVGSITAVGAPGEEHGGFSAAPADWDRQTYYATTFGQGYTVTAPQVVGAYQVLANRGVKKPLHIVASCTDAEGEVTETELPADERVISAHAADTTMKILENVAVQGDLSEQVAVPGYRIATKTGTAQKPDGQGGYKADRYLTSMVGVVPANDPEYVVMVTLDEPSRVTSSAATAPALQKAITQLMKTSRVAPADSAPDILPKFAE